MAAGIEIFGSNGKMVADLSKMFMLSYGSFTHNHTGTGPAFASMFDIRSENFGDTEILPQGSEVVVTVTGPSICYVKVNYVQEVSPTRKFLIVTTKSLGRDINSEGRPTTETELSTGIYTFTVFVVIP